jgi:hypothetical protein
MRAQEIDTQQHLLRSFHLGRNARSTRNWPRGRGRKNGIRTSWHFGANRERLEWCSTPKGLAARLDLWLTTVTPGVSGVAPRRDAAGLSNTDDAAPESSNALILFRRP